MRVIRQIDVYSIDNDKLVAEIRLDVFNLEELKLEFGVPADDPFMYNLYKITEDHKRIFKTVNFDFSKFEYYLMCFEDH